MDDVTATQRVDVAPRPAKHTGRNGRWFFFGAALTMTALAVFSFSSTFYLKGIVVSAVPPQFPLPLYMIVHGCVMTAWCLFFVAQTWLAASGRTAQHRLMGWAGAALAAAVVVVGLHTTLNMVSLRTAVGLPVEAVIAFGMHHILIGNLIGIPCFAGLVTAAILLRRRREWHGRLMYWAFMLTMGPVFGGGGTRMLGPLLEASLPQVLLGVPLLPPVALAALVIHDFRSRGRLHPATLLGFGVLVAAGLAGFAVAETEAGKAFFVSLG